MGLSRNTIWKTVTVVVFPIFVFVAASAWCLIRYFTDLAPASAAIQVETTRQPNFDVASLKLAADQDTIETRPKRSVGRFRWNTDLLTMICYAYQMESWRVAGKSGLETIYRLDATVPPNTTQDRVRLMLQALLTERLHLEFHRETKEVSEGYSLSVAKGGPKLHVAEPLNSETESAEFDDGYVVGPRPEADTMLLRGHNASMLQLAGFLQRNLGTNVLDRTDLVGRYDFELNCTVDESGPSPNLIGSCIKQAGLVLGKYKGPVEFVVIDHVGPLVEN